MIPALLLSVSISVAAPPAHTRAMIVFDNSGSMRQNDPNRLAQAAASLLVDLGRPGDEAGLEIFDEGAQVPVSIGPVAERRRAFRRALSRTTLRGRHTNLGQALAHALNRLQARPKRPGVREVVVLLTDGKLDLGAKRRAEEPVERARILRQLMPAFRRRGVQVYAIAFTEQADRALLAQVAKRSRGAFWTIHSPGQLHKAFTEVFVLSSGASSLPIEDNRFVVDPSVKGTSLVLSQGEGRNRVVAPDEAVVDSSHPHPGVNWDSSKGYDLVEIKNPQAGAWQVKGTDQAVAIISDSSVRFEVETAPAEATMDVPVRVTARLMDHDKPMESFAKLKGMSVTARVKEPSGKERTVVLKSKKVGMWKGELESPEPGQYGVVVTARSPTLSRQRKVSYAVGPPCFEQRLELPPEEGGAPSLLVHMAASCPEFKQVKVSYARKLAGRRAKFQSMPKVESALYAAEIALAPAGQNVEVIAQVKIKTREGESFTLELEPLAIPQEPPTSMVAQVLMILAVINIPLLLGVGLVFFLVRRRMNK